MKTTIDIADPLLVEAKALSSREKTTLRALVEEGLREVLVRHQDKKPFRLKNVSVKGKGLRPELRGASWEKIRDMIYEGRGA